MTQEALLSLMKRGQFTPTIINTADSTCYLIGGEDDRGNFYHLKDRDHHSVTGQSLHEAKEKLCKLGIHQAVFEMITPYDEMIGCSEGAGGKVRYEITF
ncbi:DUF6482 family protein [Photobacterium sp. DNB22_13_2]